MKKEVLLFFTDGSEESAEIKSSLEDLSANVVLVESVDEMIRTVRSRNVVMILAYDNVVPKKKLDIGKLLAISALPSHHSVFIIGNPLVYDFSKNTHITAVIPRDLDMEEKIEEIQLYWESELIVAQEEDRLNRPDIGGSLVQSLEAELEEKRRKLSALHIEISRMKKQLNDIYQKWMAKDIRRSNDEWVDLHRAIKTANQINEGWSEVEESFIAVEPEFVKKLRGTNRELTDENKRMCMYLRMGVNNKEISNLLNIQYSSVKKAQSRLKAVFGLPKEVSLRDYIQQL